MINPKTSVRSAHLFSSRGLVASLSGAALLLLAGCGESDRNAGAPAAPASGGSSASSSSTASAPMTLPSADTGAVMPAPATPADKAWTALQEAFSSPPQPPDSWAAQPPSDEAIQAFQKERADAALRIADMAKDFYTQFEADPRSTPARYHEMQLLDAAVKLGRTNTLERLEKLEQARLADPKVGEEERFGLKMMAAQRTAERLFPEGEERAKASLEASARQLIEEFPQRPEPYQLLLNLASDATPEKARATAQSLSSTNAPEDIREAAQSLLRKLDLVGKPLDLKFKAIDGRDIDLAAMRGKVVLVDFWATWCGPCIAELPKVKETYERLHPKGFEIVGISFDQERDALTKFVEQEKMAWPQYFDGKGWENELGIRFGISAIPAMWLVDRQGVLRDLGARGDLEAKVEKLLAEPAP